MLYQGHELVVDCNLETERGCSHNTHRTKVVAAGRTCMSDLRAKSLGHI